MAQNTSSTFFRKVGQVPKRAQRFPLLYFRVTCFLREASHILGLRHASVFARHPPCIDGSPASPTRKMVDILIRSQHLIHFKMINATSALSMLEALSILYGGSVNEAFDNSTFLSRQATTSRIMATSTTTITITTTVDPFTRATATAAVKTIYVCSSLRVFGIPTYSKPCFGLFECGCGVRTAFQTLWLFFWLPILLHQTLNLVFLLTVPRAPNANAHLLRLWNWTSSQVGLSRLRISQKRIDILSRHPGQNRTASHSVLEMKKATQGTLEIKKDSRRMSETSEAAQKVNNGDDSPSGTRASREDDEMKPLSASNVVKPEVKH